MLLSITEREMIAGYMARCFAEHWSYETGLPESLCAAMYRKVPWVSKGVDGQAHLFPALDDLSDEALIQHYVYTFDPLEPETEAVDREIQRFVFRMAFGDVAPKREAAYV